MILGLGIDVVDVERFAETLARTPALVERLFAPSEQDLPVVSLAARFAAKEALAKALGAPGGLSWTDVVVHRSHRGRPSLELLGDVLRVAQDLGVARVHVSLSHDGGVATAVVVAED